MVKNTIGEDQDEIRKQKEVEAQYRRDQKTRISDLRKVLLIPEGRRVIWRILEEAKVMAEAFSLNALETAKWQGERHVGIRLLEDLMKAKPESFYQMFCEAKAKSNEKIAKTEEETNDTGTS